jgi:hypothetical protein
MKTDILTSIELTASAAIVVTVAALIFPRARQRFAAVGAFSVWWIAAIVIASLQLLAPSRFGAPGLGITVLTPIALMLSATLLNGNVRNAVMRAPLWWLVAVNAVRVLGVSFLVLHAQERLPSAFALVAGWGDIAVGLAAIPVATMAARGGRRAGSAVWLWNVLGLVDLMAAVSLGVMSSPGPLHLIHDNVDATVMTSLPYFLIPGFLVPALATSHLLIFLKLKRHAWGESQQAAFSPSGLATKPLTS